MTDQFIFSYGVQGTMLELISTAPGLLSQRTNEDGTKTTSARYLLHHFSASVPPPLLRTHEDSAASKTKRKELRWHLKDEVTVSAEQPLE
ncbi:hypothetical protein TNCV_4805181 [Trichonephila clavipes]|nr:hypothetical protein TNCV_4805181 [Trichonephila clavipes]